MRGSPLWQVLFVAVAFALAGWPVYRLTRPAAAEAAGVATSPAASPAPSTAPESVELEAVFAPPPGDFEVKYLDQTVAAGQGPQTRFTAHWTATIPPEGADLVVHARWPLPAQGSEGVSALPAAVRLTARFSDGRQAEKTFWSGADGTAADVFTLQK